jgi:hypothetical protein
VYICVSRQVDMNMFTHAQMHARACALRGCVRTWHAHCVGVCMRAHACCVNVCVARVSMHMHMRCVGVCTLSSACDTTAIATRGNPRGAK